MSLAGFILVLDTTMINVAIPAIVGELKTTVQGVQAAISLYALVMAAFMLAGGKFADVYGMKKMFVMGSVLYGIGALTAALAPNLGVLVIGWSIVEGFGAALILPITMIACMLEYKGAKRAYAFAMIGGVQASAAAIGPIYGGFMTAQFSWRWAFASEIVIVLIMLALIRPVRDSEPAKGETVDWLGIFESALGLALVVAGFIMSSQYGWWEAKRVFVVGGLEIAPFGLSIVPFVLGAGFIFIALFIHQQQRREDNALTPLLRLGLLDNQRFVSGVVVSGILNLILAGILFTTPLFLQSALDLDALQAGIALLPLSITTLVFALSTPGLGARFKPAYIVQLGFLVMIVGTLDLWFVTKTGIKAIDLAPGLAIFGVGTGLVLAQITNITQSAVTDEESGEAAGFNNAIRQLGTSLGTALIGAILLTHVYSGIAESVLEAQDIPIDARSKMSATIALENAAQTMTAAKERQILSKLPKKVLHLLDQIVDEAWTAADKTSLLALAFFIILAMVAASFLTVRKKAPDGTEPQRE